MRNLILLIILLIAVTACRTQAPMQPVTLNTNNINNNSSIKKFDLDTFKKNKIGNHYQVETEESIILQWEEAYCYYEQITYKKNSFAETFVYYKDIRTLVAYGRRCYNFNIGITQE